MKSTSILNETVEQRWNALLGRIVAGDRLTGRIDQIASFGVFVDLGEEFPGFVDVLELDDTPLNIGDAVDVEVLGFTAHNRQIRLAIRNATSPTGRDNSKSMSARG
ncbi:MAG: S1 RNA-binding domain-containing protein [Planctomycetaceae bacterium]